MIRLFVFINWSGSAQDWGCSKGLGIPEGSIKGVWHVLSSSYPRHTMTSDNCTVGPNRKLLDASEIAWAHDPDNAMAHKRKLSNDATANPSRRARQASPEHEEAEATDPGPTDTENENPVDPGVSYQETKALGDADREVRVHRSSRIPI